MTGRIRCEVSDQSLFVGSPSPTEQWEANRIFHEALIDAQLFDIIGDKELLDYLTDTGLWTVEEQTQIDAVPDKIEAYKVEMYNSYVSFQGKRVQQVRRAIKRLLREVNPLFIKRHAYDVYTCEGFAQQAKLQYICNVTATDLQGNVVDLSHDTYLIQDVVHIYMNTRIAEQDIRLLARTEPWRSIWSAGKAEGQLFGIPAISLTEEQRSIITWSSLYDNIRESPDCPTDTVVNDDDLLDGWLVVQHRKNEQEKKQQGTQKVGQSEKMARAAEIFLPVETPEDAQRVNDMNDAQARMVKRQRAHMIQQHGVVPDQNMPDSQLKMRAQAMQEMRQRVKG